jgi:alanine dehydrogenase
VIVGIPTEIKKEEYRVALTPAGARELTAAGHRVLVQRGAGKGSSLDDQVFVDAGAELIETAEEVFAAAEMIVKVKEPQLTEIEFLRPGQLLFTFLHIAAYPEMGKALVDSGVTAVAYETVELPSGALPLLAPMSEIAGRMAAQAGAHHLERPHGGRGVLMGGVPGVAPARVTVVGAGRAGANAAMIAAGMGAEVIVLDLNVEPLRHLDEMQLGRVFTVRSSIHAVEEYVASSDLVIGAVLVPGARAPVVVSEEVIAAMRPGSVAVDISIDQGGCIATARETTHADPTYVVHDVVHYAVGNIPGAVPNTSTHALTNATLPYVVALASGVGPALATHPELAPGFNVAGGSITHAAVARSLDLPLADLADVV